MIAEMLLAQLTDPFRIGLLIALMLTTRRTIAETGTWLPLAAGIAFIAVLIPNTLGSTEGDKTMAVAVGLMSNAILLAVIYAVWQGIMRILPKR